jgi:hypothetical protein
VAFLINRKMIYIIRNTTNQVVLTLTESVTIPNPFFIFSFQPLATLNEYQPLIYFTTLDLSNYCNRYNLFEIVEDDNGSTNGGNDIPLYLKPGQYQYKVYQSTTASLNPNTFGSLLEEGKMVVGDLTQPDQDTGVTEIYR